MYKYTCAIIILMCSTYSYGYYDYLSEQQIDAQYQWGMHSMEFPRAWEVTKGNAYIASLDGIGWKATQGREGFSGVRKHFTQAGYDPTGNDFKPTLIHGIHVLGIIGADGSDGLWGGCPNCSLLPQPIADADPFGLPVHYSMVNGIRRSFFSGIQVLNFSNGDNDDYPVEIKDALDEANRRDIVIVAASGNNGMNVPQFPARYSHVLAVGGVTRLGPQPWARLALERAAINCNSGDVLSQAPHDGVVAPAHRIISTYITGKSYYTPTAVPDNAERGCRWFSDAGNSVENPHYRDIFRPDDGYGNMTGTSMAAPHVSALVGLVRSINPLLAAHDVRELVRRSSDFYGANANQLHTNFVNGTNFVGAGLPSAHRAVNMALASNPSRLTPLFSLYSETRKDHVYSIFPQVAVSAINGELLHVDTFIPIAKDDGYLPVGDNIFPSKTWFFSGYDRFPSLDAAIRPKAQVWVFTTDSNPFGVESLAPLYRLSWKCANGNRAELACTVNPNNTNFVYTASESEKSTFISEGFNFDGIEGYIYPKSQPQPEGTVRLLRRYNYFDDDYAIFPEDQLDEMVSKGYIISVSEADDWLGYVYQNNGITMPTYTVSLSSRPTVVPFLPGYNNHEEYNIIRYVGDSPTVQFRWARIVGAEKYRVFVRKTNGLSVSTDFMDSNCQHKSYCSTNINLKYLVVGDQPAQDYEFTWEVREIRSNVLGRMGSKSAFKLMRN